MSLLPQEEMVTRLRKRRSAANCATSASAACSSWTVADPAGSWSACLCGEFVQWATEQESESMHAARPRPLWAETEESRPCGN